MSKVPEDHLGRVLLNQMMKADSSANERQRTTWLDADDLIGTEAERTEQDNLKNQGLSRGVKGGKRPRRVRQSYSRSAAPRRHSEILVSLTRPLSRRRRKRRVRLVRNGHSQYALPQ